MTTYAWPATATIRTTPLSSPKLLNTGMTTTGAADGDTGLAFGQKQKCGGAKSVNGPIIYFWYL